MNYDAPSEIKKLLEERGLALKKRFGQNFLVNRNAREKIVACLESEPGELVWEIGPGLGAMTELLLEKPGTLVVFEIDRGLVRLLNEFFSGRGALTVLEGDALDNLGPARERFGPPARILGNLPYSSASQIIAAFIDTGLAPKKIVVTVQKELALRLRAAPGDKNYSSFSVLGQSFFDIALEFELKGGNFYPRPEVDSAVVSLAPVNRLETEPARRIFFKLIRQAFGSRRKTLNNNLLKTDAFTAEQREIIRKLLLEKAGGLSARAEELPPAIYRELARQLAALQGESIEKKTTNQHE